MKIKGHSSPKVCHMRHMFRHHFSTAIVVFPLLLIGFWMITACSEGDLSGSQSEKSPPPQEEPDEDRNEDNPGDGEDDPGDGEDNPDDGDDAPRLHPDDGDDDPDDGDGDSEDGDDEDDTPPPDDDIDDDNDPIASIDDTCIVWKPISEKNRKLVILLPTEYGAPDIYIQDREGNVIEKGDYVGRTNGNRATYRFSKSGGQYPNPCYLEVGDALYEVNNPRLRHSC